jgi:O-antigen/teichoic acid export membrane protein
MISKLRKLSMVLKKSHENRSLDEKLLVSSALTGFDQSVHILCRLVSTLVLTRLLSPEIFGVFAVVIMFHVIVFMLTDFGVRSLIIVSDEVEDRKFLRTCWSVQAARGLGIYSVILLIACGLWTLQQITFMADDSVYATPELPFVMAVSGLMLVLQGLESVNQHVHARELKFGKICLLNLAMAVIAPVITIAIVWVWPSLWALAIASVVGGILRTFLTFSMFPGVTMGFAWEKKHAQELFNRGKWIMSHSMLTVFATSADKILLSAFLPATTFGIYTLAYQIIDIPRQFLLKFEHSLFLQVFREIDKSDTLGGIQREYYRYRIPFDLMACMAAGGFLTASPALIDLMYDPRYAQAGEIMQILAIGLPFVGMGIIREAFHAQKRFRLMTLISVIHAGSIWLGLIVALPVLGSVMGAFLVIALFRLPELLVLLGLAKREGWIVPWKEVRIWPVIVVGAVLGWGVDYIWFLAEAPT